MTTLRFSARRLLLAAAIVPLLAAVPGTGSPAALQSEQGRPPDEEAELRPYVPQAIDRVSPPASREQGMEEGPWPAATMGRFKGDPAAGRALPLADDPFELAAARLAQVRARPAIVSRFSGLDRSESGGSFPPDTTIAVGPQHVLQAVNLATRLTTRDGIELDMASSFEQFGVPLTGFLSDPKLHYDPFTKRFYMVLLQIDFNAGEAWFHLALSRTSSPASLAPDDWCTYRYSTVRQGAWGDYPGLGMNDRWLAVSTNNFGFQGGFQESRLFVVDKSKATGELASCPNLKLFAFNPGVDDQGFVAFNPQPAQHYDASTEKDSPLYAVSSHFNSSPDSGYTIWKIAGKGKRPRLSHEIVDSEIYAVPPNATQPGGLELDSGDHRVMQQATFRNGQLWIAHSTACEVKGSSELLSCVRVVGLRPEGEEGPVVDFEATLGRKKEYAFWPGVIVTDDGDVVVAALRSGTIRYLETVVYGMAKGAARFAELVSLPRAPRFGKPRTSESGQCTPINVSVTTDGRSIARSGDYVGLALDPASDDLWVSGEHGETNLAGGCIWGTDVVRVKF